MNPQPEPLESVLELEVGRIADEFEALCRQGQPPAIEEFVGRYPHLADVLREILPAIQILQRSAVKNADTEKPCGFDTSPHPASGATGPVLVDGAYEILGELGRGGMGIVFKARQVALDRVVALKMIRAGVAASPDEHQRFQREAQTVALLCHPNIVQIYAVGECAGQPFFSLEYLEGGSLAAKLNGQPQPPRQAAELVETLARAIAAAHQLGLVHRDLKPANVLLAADGTPKIADFGLVKHLANDSMQTQGGAIVGTPSYMAPEQASGQSKNIGPAADIYALGAILYDLLTGRPPFKAATTLETLEQVRLQEPASPLQLQPGCPRDLETICLKCLSKDPARRYSSAADLAEDLRRFSANEPIRARPVGVIERADKWVRRRPAAAGLVAVSIAAILAVVAVGGVSYWQVNDALDEKTKSESDAQASLTREKDAGVAMKQALFEKQKALKREEIARKDLQSALEREKLLRRQDRQVAYLGKIALAQRALELNDVTQADHYLRECPFDLRQWEWHYLAGARYAEVTTFRGHDDAVRSIAYRPDGKRIASVSGNRGRSIIHVWNPATGKVDFSLPCTGTVQNVAFSPNGEWLAASASNEIDKTGWLKVWHAQKGTEIKVSNYTKDPRVRVNFSADSRRLITETNLEIQSIETTTWKPGPKLILARDLGASAAFSPDGNTFVYYRREGGTGNIKGRATVRLRNIQTHQEQIFPAHTAHVMSLAISQNGKYLAAGDGAGAIHVWDVASGKEIHVLLGHVQAVRSLAFSADNRYLTSGSVDHTAKVWHVVTGQLAFTVYGHASWVQCVAFAPDGQHIATASADQTVKVWRLSTHATLDVAMPDRADGAFSALAFHPQGHLALATRAGAILIRKHMTGEQSRLEAPDADWRQLAYSKDGRPSRLPLPQGAEGKGVRGPILAAAGITKEAPAGIVQTWDKDGKALVTFRGHEVEDRARRGRRLSVCVALGEKAPLAASATRDEFGSGPHTVKIWDPMTGVERFTYRGHEASIIAVAFSPNGDRVASAEWSFNTKRGRIKVWDAKDGKDLFTLDGYFGQEADSLAFSPDGTTLAACAGQNVLFWDAQTGVPLRTLTGHSAQVVGIDFSADGQRLLTVSQDRTAKLWDLITGREALTLHLGTPSEGEGKGVREGAEHGFVQARFSPDQQSIAALAAEGERRFVKLWLAPLQREPTFLGGAAGLPRHLSITPDGRWLFASWNDFTAWNLETNREEFRLPKGNINAVAYDAKDGRCAVVDVVGPNKVSVKFLDLATRLELFTLCQSQAAIHCLALSPDGNQLAVPLFDNSSQRSVIKLWDLRTGEASITCAPHAGQVWAMAFADDGQRLIAASSPKGGKGELTTWNAATGAKVQAHTLDTDEVFPAAFSPDCRYLATSSAARPGEVKLWDVASGQLLGAIPLARRGLSLAFSRDGKHLAIGTDVLIDSRLHGLAKICKVPSCEEVVSLLDPGESFYRVAFHPQGRWLVTAHQHVKIWDLKARLP